MSVPYSEKVLKINAGGEGYEYRYTYPDSSLIYITSILGVGTVNDTFIKQRIDYYNKKIFSDSILMSGTTGNGNYWKEIKYYGVYYGYSNVSLERKRLYDSLFNFIRHDE
jgi:hypothetical protein